MKRIVSLALTVVMLIGCVFALASCGGSVYPKLEKAFIAEDFEVVTELDTITNKIKEELEEDEFAVELHILMRKDWSDLATALIIEFKSTEELVNAYKDSATLQGFVKDIQNNEDVKAFYNSMVEKGYAKGNCLIVPILNGDDVRDIVKGA